MKALEDLPTRIQSIKQPTWFDVLRWTLVNQPWAMSDVDHDWRIWVNLKDGSCTTRHKGELGYRSWTSLTSGLASLDYQEAPDER